jgi:hypothetical protein
MNMSQATETNTTPTRRTALGFSLAAFVAGLTVPVLAGATPAPDADAELLRQCAECLAVDAQLKAIDEYLVEEVDDDTMNDLVVKWTGFRRTITAIPATTAEGRIQKAKVAFGHMRLAEEIESQELNDLVRSALADVIDGGDVA